MNITGFTIEDASFSCGILLRGVNNCNISTNVVSGNSQGIYLTNSIQNIIANNTVKNNGASGITLMYSNDNEIRNNTANSNHFNGIHLNNSNNNRITDNDASNTVNWDGISLDSSNNNEIRNNTVNSNNYNGIILLSSSDENIIANNTVKHNGDNGILLYKSNNNRIIDNNASNTVKCDGIALSSSSNNEVRNNNANSNNYNGIVLWISSDRNIVANNTAKYNGDFGIIIKYSNNNKIYLNSFMDNRNNNAYSIGSTNVWNSPSKITYTYKGSTYTNYLGNYWNDYTGTDGDGDGIGDAPYVIPEDNKDNYPLIQHWENYVAPAASVFDTDTCTYLSIMGTHKGTITPNKTIMVHKMYTYPCVGTGGHTEYVKFYGNGLDVTKTWNGYIDNYHYIFFDPPFTLQANTSYDYEIRTGSYPQIIHKQSLLTTNGTINCTQFTDANGKTYPDWISAIKLE